MFGTVFSGFPSDIIKIDGDNPTVFSYVRLNMDIFLRGYSCRLTAAKPECLVVSVVSRAYVPDAPECLVVSVDSRAHIPDAGGCDGR